MDASASRRRRRAVYAMGAVMLGLLPFVLVEGLLRICGIGIPSSYQDPFVGFSERFPLFELDADAGQFQTARHHHYFFGIQTFPATKKPATFRAFCLGGSTVLGHPYDTETAFPKWLEIELAGRDPSRDYEIINCGGMSYASYRLIPILEEVLTHDPDLIVVMTGHNEFLEDRTYQSIKQRAALRVWVDDRVNSLRLVTLGRRVMDRLRDGPQTPANTNTFDQEVDARLDHKSGYASYRRDPQWWAGVTAHFDLNLRVMVRLCRKANVPILLINPGSNLRDCPPFKSEHKSGLTTARLATWSECFRSASAMELEDSEQALKLYERAAAIDDLHATLVFRTARCLDRLGQYERAREAYNRAKELDVCPLRMLDVMRQSVFDVAESTTTPVVDAAGLLEDKSRQGIVGSDWYVDHVHPTIRGHQLIAQAVVARLHDAGLVSPTKPTWSSQDRRKAYQNQMEILGDQYLAAGRRRVEWLERWARRDRLREDIGRLDARAKLDLANSYVEFGEYARAKESYRQALAEDPTRAVELVGRALQLFQGGRGSDAERVVLLTLEADAERSAADAAHVALTVLASADGRTEDTRERARLVRTELADLDAVGKAWLDEMPAARDLFK